MDTNLTQDLINEGIVREFVSKIQALRKESGFVVTDHIRVDFFAEHAIKDAIVTYSEQIKGDTLCDQLIPRDSAEEDLVKELDVNGSIVRVKINKI